jgi:uncharacterized protein YndB with AHSA1/START domain
MEFGKFETTHRIDAAPEIVYRVVTDPAYIDQWWNVEAEFEPTAGSAGVMTWDRASGEKEVAPIRVVEARPGRRFSFWWIAPPGVGTFTGAELSEANAILVTFQIDPDGEGTLLTVTEEGMRELGWEAALLERYMDLHAQGWQVLLPRIADLAESRAVQ